MEHPSVITLAATDRQATLLAAAQPPAAGRRRPRRRRGAVPVAALAAVAVLSAACGDQDEASAGGSTPSTEAPAPADGASASDEVATSLDVTASDFAFDVERTRVGAGLVTINLTNEGAEPHQVSLVELDDGVTADDWVETFDADGEVAAQELGEMAGGVNPIPTGEQAAVRTELEPGTYALICFVPGPDGESHVSKGMYAEIEVVETDARPVAPPDEVVGDIVMADYSITAPPGGLGEAGTYRFRNEGTESHEVIFLRLEDGMTMADLIAYQQGGATGEPPFTFEGGLAGIRPGGEAYAELDLEPGSWVAICVIQSPATRQAHVDMGMVLPFEVS